MKDRSHDTAMVEHFRADPTYAAELLAEVRRDGTPGRAGHFVAADGHGLGRCCEVGGRRYRAHSTSLI